MRKVAIASYGTSIFRKTSRSSLFEVACEPCVKMLRNGPVARNEIDVVLVSSSTSEQYIASITSEMLGIRPSVSHRIDNLCNSGTNAIVSAFSYISSGLTDVALVIGVEKYDSPGNVLVWDITRGSFVHPVYWAAMFANAHMRKYGTTEEQMAEVSVKNHRNATKNPNALFFEKPVTLNDVMQSKKIADPIKKLDCSVTCEGSSAVIMLSDDKAKELQIDNAIWINGIGMQTDSASFSKAAFDLSGVNASKIAGKKAFKMAMREPSSIDVAELHDAFTILEILAYEDLGFVEKGKGGVFAEQCSLATNPRGGIIGCGHPIGATGVSQVAEIACQLLHKAGQRQVKGCKTGLVHNLAAAGTSATVLILGV